VTTDRPRDDRAGRNAGVEEDAMATGTKARGQTVAATFEGPLRSDAALTALKDAGFQPSQVAVQVAPGTAASTGAGDDGAGARTIALVAGVVLGALVGALIGRGLGDGTLALVLGAVIGAVVGAALAAALARRGANKPAPGRDPKTPRPGSVTLTVTAASAAQAQQARSILAKQRGDIHA